MRLARSAIKGGVLLAVALVLVGLSAGTALACNPSIGDLVWEDLNRNGIQDTGEPGIPGVTVKLYKCDGTYVNTTTTNAGGRYSFSVASGNYYVKFALPSGYFFSPQDEGNDALDSDADPSTGMTICTNLASWENDCTWDAGMYRLASVSDFVWLDSNQNGIQDAGEPGVAGVTVELWTCDGSLIDSTTTNSVGFYGFFNLAPGAYRLKFVLPPGYVFSSACQGGDSALDSDADPNTGETACFTLVSGQNDTTWDAGIYRPETPVPGVSYWSIAGMIGALAIAAAYVLRRKLSTVAE